MLATMSSIVPHGRWDWDQTLFPEDEQRARLQDVQAAMRERGFDSLLVFGNNRVHGNLSFLTQYFPLEAFGIVIVPVEGEITIVSGMAIPPRRAWAGSQSRVPADGSLRSLVSDARRIGIVGFDDANVGLRERLLRYLDASPADDVLREVRAQLRPRERTAMKMTTEIAASAAQTLVDSFDSGAGNRQAVIDAELTARRAGAAEFRAVVNRTEGGAPMPIESVATDRTETITAYLAVEYLGYWVPVCISHGRLPSNLAGSAQGALEAMTGMIRPGMAAREVADAGLRQLSERQRETALSFGLGNGIGLDPNLPPLIASSSEDQICEHQALALRVHLNDSGRRCLAGAVVLV
ncbi:MAG: aminopeptidase P family N-terminal domain-containing protein, partial [Chloroflexi bacterium]|nr:aminopeptidase P family N-terminal domain-containing protein [Chloroflexota bacterium]